ncbi:MAG: polyketide cyclase, partial [Bacteroidia bacterium]
MKKFLYVVIALLVLYLILAMIGPKEIKVERNISINKSPALVVSKLTDLKYFHDEWSPWSEKDPNMKNTYTGTP